MVSRISSSSRKSHRLVFDYFKYHPQSQARKDVNGVWRMTRTMIHRPAVTPVHRLYPRIRFKQPQRTQQRSSVYTPTQIPAAHPRPRRVVCPIIADRVFGTRTSNFLLVLLNKPGYVKGTSVSVSRFHKSNFPDPSAIPSIARWRECHRVS